MRLCGHPLKICYDRRDLRLPVIPFAFTLWIFFLLDPLYRQLQVRKSMCLKNISKNVSFWSSNSFNSLNNSQLHGLSTPFNVKIISEINYKTYEREILLRCTFYGNFSEFWCYFCANV